MITTPILARPHLLPSPSYHLPSSASTLVWPPHHRLASAHRRRRRILHLALLRLRRRPLPSPSPAVATAAAPSAPPPRPARFLMVAPAQAGDGSRFLFPALAHTPPTPSSTTPPPSRLLPPMRRPPSPCRRDRRWPALPPRRRRWPAAPEAASDAAARVIARFPSRHLTALSPYNLASEAPRPVSSRTPPESCPEPVRRMYTANPGHAQVKLMHGRTSRTASKPRLRGTLELRRVRRKPFPRRTRKRKRKHKLFDSTLGFPGEGPLSIIGWNINGLLEPGKADALFHAARSRQIAILFIQEHNHDRRRQGRLVPLNRAA